MAQMKPNLIYTIAVDLPGEHSQRAMAKMMVSSALRCDPNVEVAVFTNSERPLFQIERSQVHEIPVVLEPSEESFWDRCMALKYRARHAFDGRDFGKVLFLDSDCLVLQGLVRQAGTRSIRNGKRRRWSTSAGRK